MAATDTPWNLLLKTARRSIHPLESKHIFLWKCLMNSYTLSMLWHLYSCCHWGFLFQSQLPLWVQNQNTSEQADIWKQCTTYCIITAKLLLSSLFCAKSGSELHVNNTGLSHTLSCTISKRFKCKPTAASQDKNTSFHTHTDIWSAWDVWPDKLHTLVRTNFLMASKCTSVSCLCTWCSSNAG